MRISDWSSDVCSSDLAGTAAFAGERAHGELVFENVSLRYSRDDDLGADGEVRHALHEISFSARPGTVTAIVGRSGSGKTSLVRLVPRFYEPSSGRITLDGVDLHQYRLTDLRRQIALVGQRSEEHTSELQSLMRTS